MKIVGLIRKYATPLALLAIGLGSVAAPFLIPENPDHAVFRSGSLGLILLLACISPLRKALRQASARQLLCGAAFGFLFSIALSLGSELCVYGGLLPGMGSMIRRIAVPIMAMPLFGILTARLFLLQPSAEKNNTIAFGHYMMLFLICWLPLLIAYYPGMLNYDFHTEYDQFLARQWDNRHPLLYIVLCYGIFSLGHAFSQPELAVFIVTLLRMTALAAALAYACVFAQRRRAPWWAMLSMTALYALLPVFSVMAVSSAKDTPFAAAVLMLSLLSWEALENPKAFFSSKPKQIIFIISVLFTWHMRKNGIAALCMLPLLVAACREARAQMARLCCLGVLLSALLAFSLNAILRPAEQPSFQTYSIPAQQLTRAYNLGDMTEAEREELRSWYVDSSWGLQLLPHLADAAKGSLDPERLAREGDAFMDLWARVGKKNLRVYTEAFLLLNIGSWYPDDRTHATIYQPYGLDKGYLQTDEYDLSEHGIKKHNLLPAVRNLTERICRRNEYQKYPVISQLLCTATPLWMILLSVFSLIAHRRGRLAFSSVGMLALWLSYLFGPCTLARYMLPLFCLAPAMLVLSLCTSDKSF